MDLIVVSAARTVPIFVYFRPFLKPYIKSFVSLGTAYGHGSYFARDFKYSTGYGQGTIFYAKVLTGNFTVGASQMKVAPDLDISKGTKYDSVVNDLANPAIYVVFSDNHAYPAYLITYN